LAWDAVLIGQLVFLRIDNSALASFSFCAYQTIIKFLFGGCHSLSACNRRTCLDAGRKLKRWSPLLFTHQRYKKEATTF
jgi:hypothetical protein